MMNERDAFLRGIAANIYDDTPRLAFADWLDEYGEHDRAEFIRVQCELEPIRDRYEIPRAAELHAREEHFGAGKYLDGSAVSWLGPLPERWNTWPTRVTTEYRRGFPDIVRLNSGRFVEDGALIRSAFPTLRRLVAHSFNGWGERLAACAALRGLPELELACWYEDADIRALAASPNLADLRVLVLWMGRQSEFFEDPNLIRIAAEGAAWPNLHELILVDPEGESEVDFRPLVELANRTAGRVIGRYERGYPELFPLAADFDYDFPVCGHLPDGRAAIVFLDSDLNPQPGAPSKGLVIITFDATGQQADEVLRVPLSPNLAPADGDASRLVAATGLAPGFIRVKGFRVPDYNYPGPVRGRYDDWDLRGYPDEPGTEGSGDHVYGRGGEVYELVRNGEFEVGYSGWADKRGYVHST